MSQNPYIEPEPTSIRKLHILTYIFYILKSMQLIHKMYLIKKQAANEKLHLKHQFKLQVFMLSINSAILEYFYPRGFASRAGLGIRFFTFLKKFGIFIVWFSLSWKNLVISHFSWKILFQTWITFSKAKCILLSQKKNFIINQFNILRWKIPLSKGIFLFQR